MVWLNANTIAFSIPRGYYIVHILTGAIQELLATGNVLSASISGFTKSPNQIITRLPENRLLLSRESGFVLFVCLLFFFHFYVDGFFFFSFR
jgi:hypothetical protein